MKKLIYFLSLSLMIFLTQSCKNNAPEVKSKEIEKNKSVKSLHFLNSNLNPIYSLNTIKESFIDSDPVKNIYAADMTLSDAEFKVLLEKTKANFLQKIDGDVISFVLYMSDFNTDVTSSNIQAVSLFIKENNSLVHKFYIKKENQYNEILEFGGSISSYSTFDFDVLLNYTLKKIKYYKSPAYVSFNPASSNKIISNSENSLSTILINSLVDIDVDPSSGCGSKCHNEDGGCDINSEGEKMCDNCASEQPEAVAAKNNIKFDTESTFSKATAYDFRDNFLKKSAFGRKYVNYYYKLSYFMRAKKLINKENFWKNISLGLKLYTVAKKLQYGNSDEIILTKEDAKEITDMINFYKNQTSNPSIINMLSDIEMDMNNFIDKSNAEAMKLFK